VERAAFQALQPTLPAHRIWFLDEFGIHFNMTRTQARAPRGQRAVVCEPFEKGPTNFSVIGAITLHGVQAPMMIEGALDGDALEAYVKYFLAPQLRRGDLVIWDNVATHKKLSVVALIEDTGARLVRLPAYSPDFNPKEECISKIKAELRRVRAGTKRHLLLALKRAYAQVSLSDIRGWFIHSGYCVP
jgi:transposase